MSNIVDLVCTNIKTKKKHTRIKLEIAMFFEQTNKQWERNKKNCN